MRILVNYSAAESNYLPILKYHIRRAGMEAISTSSNLTLGELLRKAEVSSCEAIFLANADTLINCVPGESPTLSAYRGSVLRTSIPIVVGNPLAHSHTVSHGAFLLEIDLKKCLTAKQDKMSFSFNVIHDAADMEAAYITLKAASFIAYDIETVTLNEDEETLTAGDTVISCASWTGVYSDKSMITYVLPLIDFGIDHWRTDWEYRAALQFLRSVNALTIPKAMHNGFYDSLHSIVYRAEPRNWVIDTMGMAHAQYSELPKTLDFVASIVLPDYIYWKGESSAAASSKDINRYWQYNALDTFYTARIALHYLYNMPAYARRNYAESFPFVYPALYCAFEGIKIDNEERQRLLNQYEESLTSLLKQLRVLTGDPNFNPSSPKQVAEYVYDLFGGRDVHIGKSKAGGTTKKKSRGTDEKNLSAVGSQHPILLRITDAIIKYREDRKAVSTYFTFLQKQGRLLYSINPFGTETGRASCQASSFWCGTQVQNIPSYAKSMLVADEGFTLFEADKAQSEARCTAYLAQDLALIAALEDKEKDFYLALGFLFFNIPYEEVTKYMRNKIIKKICHGTNYVMGAQTFIDNAGVANLLTAAASLNIDVTMSKFIKEGQITLKQFAFNLLELYHVPFFRVRQWYGEIKQEVAATHMLVSPLGHTRYFFGDITKDHNMLRAAIAHQPQNLSVSILNRGYWRVWGLVKRHPKDIRLKAQIHDSVMGQVRDGIPELVSLVKNAMDESVTIHGRTLTIPTTYKFGKAWKEEEA